MKKEIDKLIKTYESYEVAVANLEDKVRKICDFEARIVFCAGDRHLVLNEDNSSVATLDCLEGRTIKNKLSAEEHLLYCI